jgi:putative transposase
MEWEAEKAAQRLYQSGKITVVVQDQGSIHTCQAAKAQQVIWERQGLYIFFLPKYCSEMNRIETEWLRVKADELAGQMFEDEYDLALAVIEGIEARSQLTGCIAQRYRFNLS